MKRALFIASWVVASIIATSVAMAAVSSVTDNVTDSPSATLATGSFDDDTSSTTTPDDEGTSTTTPDDEGTSTTLPEDDGTSTTSTTLPDDDDDDDDGGTTTSTTIPDDDDDDDDTTTTSVAPVPTETVTYQLVGGWVRVTIGQGFVRLEGAAPNPGFSMRLEADEGDEVRVRFESDDHRSEFEAKWDGGELEIELDEKPEGESDDGDSHDDSHDDD